MIKTDYDVVVVGLGAMGSSALLHLAMRGIRVLGLEQFEPGHSRGASHGETRIIRTAYAEGAQYVPLLRHAWQLWADLEVLCGERLLQRTGGLVMGPAGSQAVAAPVNSARDHGLPFELLSPAEMRGRYPQHALDAGTETVYEADAGVLKPEAAVRATVRCAQELGALLRTGDQVTEIVPNAELPSVRVGDEWIRARHVVVAAGAWLTRLVPMSPTKINVVRRVFGWFDSPQDFAPERFPVFIRTGESEDYQWYGIPGPQLKVGLHFWPGLDEPVDLATGVREPDRRDAEMLEAVVGETLRGLNPVPVRMQSCMYSLTPDHNFLVGGRADLPGVTVLGGFSGHGFKFAPVIGEIAADLALTGKTRWDIGFLDPERF